MIPRVLALDLSLAATGVSCSQCGESVILTKKVEGEERLVQIRDAIQESHLDSFPDEFSDVARGHVDFVVLEGYAFARPNQAHQIGELGGVIRVLLHELNYDWLAIPPMRLKKWATGKGNAQKDEMLAAAIRHFGYEGSNNNEADAFLLRVMAEFHYAGVEQPKYRQEIDQDVDWPVIAESAGSPVP